MIEGNLWWLTSAKPSSNITYVGLTSSVKPAQVIISKKFSCLVLVFKSLFSCSCMSCIS